MEPSTPEVGGSRLQTWRISWLAAVSSWSLCSCRGLEYGALKGMGELDPS